MTDIATPIAGTVDGTPQHTFTLAADTGERIVGIILSVNAASDGHASEQIAGGIYTVIPVDYDGEVVLISPSVNIERVAILGLSSATYTAGSVVSATETSAANALAALTYVLAPTGDNIALVVSSVPTYSVGLVTGSVITMKFAEAA